MYRLESNLDRTYIVGPTFDIKDQLRDAGARFDGNAKQWYVRTHDLAPVRALLSRLSADTDLRPENLDAYPILDVVTYKDRTYFVISVDREHVRLCNDSGSFAFWTRADKCAKNPQNFRENEAQGAPITVGEFRMIQRAARRAKSEYENRGQTCPRCSRRMSVTQQLCDHCGNTTVPYADDDADDNEDTDTHSEGHGYSSRPEFIRLRSGGQVAERSPFSRDLPDQPYDG
jgi:hypothetical protein